MTHKLWVILRILGTADETKLNQQVLPVVENKLRFSTLCSRKLTQWIYFLWLIENPIKRCNRLLNDVVPDLTQMCAGEMAGGVDTCQG